MKFVNLKISERLVSDILECLDKEVDEAYKEIEQLKAENERLKTEKGGTDKIKVEKYTDPELLKELEEKDTMIEKLKKYHLEIENKYDEERKKLVTELLKLQDENTELRMICKMAGEPKKAGRPKKQ